MGFIMTKENDTDIVIKDETNCYNQLLRVRLCIDALKDVYENIPEDDRYSSVLIVVGERLEVEFQKLSVIALSSSTSNFN